jgi:hypothetical protein
MAQRDEYRNRKFFIHFRTQLFFQMVKISYVYIWGVQLREQAEGYPLMRQGPGYD